MLPPVTDTWGTRWHARSSSQSRTGTSRRDPVRGAPGRGPGLGQSRGRPLPTSASLRPALGLVGTRAWCPSACLRRMTERQVETRAPLERGVLRCRFPRGRVFRQRELSRCPLCPQREQRGWLWWAAPRHGQCGQLVPVLLGQPGFPADSPTSGRPLVIGHHRSDRGT